MNAASAMPSGILMLTMVSMTGMAADAVPAAVAMPAATDMAMKLRRESSLEDSATFSGKLSEMLSLIRSLIGERLLFQADDGFGLPGGENIMPANGGCQSSAGRGSGVIC